jgi:tetratricopeptide (TPR) repeat protein
MRHRLLAVATVIALLAPGLAVAQAPPTIPTMPANIQAIMNRMKAGQMPSPADQKALQAWGKSMAAAAGGGGGNASGPTPHLSGGQAFQVGTRETGDPCKKKGTAVGFGVTPSRDAFVAMAEDTMQSYRGHLLPDAQSSLNGVLARANGSDISTMLVMHASGSAAVVAAAYAVEKNPDDALAANNLGAILRGMHDYARAAAALQYAKSLSPNSPIIASNLGWLAMGQGDQKTASKFFNAAAAKDNKLSPVLLGQGLVQLCGGHAAQALPLFRASIANGFSDLAEAGVDSAEADLADAKDSSADNASPDVYGGQNEGGDMPNWQDPPFSGNGATMATYHDKIIKYLDYWTQNATDAANQAMKVGVQVKGGGTTGSNGQLVFQRGYKKESFVLGDIRKIISRDTSPIVEKWASDVADRALHQDGCHTCPGMTEKPSCVWRARVTPINGGVAAEEADDWTKLRKSFADVYGFSRQWIQEIHDPAQQQVETAALQQWVTTVAAPFSQVIENWQTEVMVDYGACGSTAGMSAQPFQLKPYKIDPTKCNSGEVHMNFGFANLNADCDKMTLTMGEGLVGAAEWKFAPDYTKGADGVLRPTGTDWSNDQATFFAGAGGGVPGPLSPSGAIGGYVTVQNGEVMDSGGRASVGIMPGVGGGAGAVSVGATGQVGMMSGPDVSTSGGVRIGAPCGFSC